MSSYLQDEESPFDEIFKEPQKKEEEKEEKEEKKEEDLLGIEHPKESHPFLEEERENVFPTSEEKFQERTLEPEKKPPEEKDILSQVGTDKFQEKELLEEEKPGHKEETKTPEKPISEPKIEEKIEEKVEDKTEKPENLEQTISTPPPPIVSESEEPAPLTNKEEKAEMPAPSVVSKPDEPVPSDNKDEKDRYISLIVDLLKGDYYEPAIDAIKEMEKAIQ